MTLVQNLESSRGLASREFPAAFGEMVPVPRTSGSGTPAATTFYDAEVVETPGVTTWNDWRVVTEFGGSISNLNSELASLDGHELTRIASGIGFVELTLRGVKSRLSYDVRQTASATSREFTDYVADSIADRLNGGVLPLLTSGKTRGRFSTINHAAGSYTLNPNSWTAGLDLSGVGVALRIGGVWSQANAPHAITARHAVAARHWGFSYAGARARWIGTDGAVVERNIIGVSSAVSSTYGDDTIVLTLDSDLPNTVTPLPVVGEWIRQGLTVTPPYSAQSAEYYSAGCLIAFNRNHEAHVLHAGWGPTQLTAGYAGFDFTYNGESFEDVASTFSFSEGDTNLALPFLADKAGFLLDVQVGDSGKPILARYGSTLALAASFFSPTSGTLIGRADGALVNEEIATADAAAGVSTGYTVTVAPDPTA